MSRRTIIVLAFVFIRSQAHRAETKPTETGDDRVHALQQLIAMLHEFGVRTGRGAPFGPAADETGDALDDPAAALSD